MLADRYIADRFLPDKAIDLIDEAAAKLKMEITSKPLALDEIDRKILQMEMETLSLSKAARSDKGEALLLCNASCISMLIARIFTERECAVMHHTEVWCTINL